MSILCHGGGSVVVPISSVNTLDEHPDRLDNLWADDYFDTSNPIHRGAWVRSSRHGHMGRVSQVHRTCPESERWIQAQEIPVSDEERAGQWVSILKHGGGSVVVPISSVTALADDEHPDGLDNVWADHTFGEEPVDG